MPNRMPRTRFGRLSSGSVIHRKDALRQPVVTCIQVSRRRFVLPALLAASIFFPSSGCFWAHTQTSRQLEANDTVASVYLDWPFWVLAEMPPAFGTLLPRVGGDLTMGLGGKGDFSIAAGTNTLVWDLGVTTRGYLTDYLTAAIGFNCQAARLPGGYAALQTQGRLSTATAPGRPLYGGVQAVVPLWMLEYDDGSKTPVGMLGLAGGYEAQAGDQNATFQVEISWWAYVAPGDMESYLFEANVIQVVIVSVGYHWWQ